MQLALHERIVFTFTRVVDLDLESNSNTEHYRLGSIGAAHSRDGECQ